MAASCFAHRPARGGRFMRLTTISRTTSRPFAMPKSSTSPVWQANPAARAERAIRRRAAICRCRRRRARIRCRPNPPAAQLGERRQGAVQAPRHVRRKDAARAVGASTKSMKRHAVSGASMPFTFASSIGAHRATPCVAACTASSSTVCPAPASFSEPGREIDRVADHRVSAMPGAAQAARHDFARCNPDVDRQRLRRPRRRARASPDGSRLRARRANRVVAVRDRCAEHGHHRIADVLVDAAAKALDDPVGGFVEPLEASACTSSGSSARDIRV